MLLLPELLDQIKKEDGENGHRYQTAFGRLLVEERPSIVVETGVHYGCSTAYILEALHEIGSGHLHSVDPTTHANSYLIDPRWTLWREESYTALPKIYAETGPWDVFLHDSDHEVYCQTFEYELAWRFLLPGGILATDDSVWGQPQHKAWEHFLERHELAVIELGNARYVRKTPAPVVHLSELQSVVVAVTRLAERATAEYSRKL